MKLPRVILLIICFLNSCDKDKIKNYEEIVFTFDMPFTVKPGTESIRVGDTLTVFAEISDSMLDLRSMKRYYLPDFKFYALFSVYRLADTSLYFIKQNGATASFDFIFPPQLGVITSGHFGRLAPVWEGGTYKYKMQMVAKQPGIFNLFITDLHPPPIVLPESFAPPKPGWKRKPLVRFNRYILNNGETHYHLLLQNAKPQQPTPDGMYREDYGTYTFRVIQ